MIKKKRLSYESALLIFLQFLSFFKNYIKKINKSINLNLLGDYTYCLI